MDKQETYFIQGFFFQKVKRFGIVQRAEVEGGATVKVDDLLFQTMFSGIFTLVKNIYTINSGQMMDAKGHSYLNFITLDDNRLDFTKRYEGRNDEIVYSFSRKEGEDLWTGIYTGDMVGEGSVQCILTN